MVRYDWLKYGHSWHISWSWTNKLLARSNPKLHTCFCMGGQPHSEQEDVPGFSDQNLFCIQFQLTDPHTDPNCLLVAPKLPQHPWNEMVKRDRAGSLAYWWQPTPKPHQISLSDFMEIMASHPAISWKPVASHIVKTRVPIRNSLASQTGTCQLRRCGTTASSAPTLVLS